MTLEVESKEDPNNSRAMSNQPNVLISLFSWMILEFKDKSLLDLTSALFAFLPFQSYYAYLYSGFVLFFEASC